MNKRITSIVLSLVMLFTMLATAVPVLAATPVELKVTADTTSANPGDTINYKVSIGAVTDMGGLEFKLDIPSGLTIDDGSISIPDGLETTIDSDGAIIVPTSSNSYYWCYSAQLTGYTGISDLVILTFSCKVDDGITGTKTVSIKDVILIDQSVNDMDFNVTGSDVNVTPAPKPATGISLNKSTLELTVGENETLVATVEPADTTDTVVWTSSKESVATVDNTGEVTAVVPGEAIITAKAGSVSATCTVKVAAAPCSHNYGTLIAEKNATCSDTGMKAHYQCSLCGAYFDEGKTEKTLADLTIPVDSNAHNFNMGEWGYKGADGHSHVCNHNPAHHDTVVAHDFSTGDTCTVCGYERMHVCANHLTKVDRVEADCTNPGNIEHYKCSCGKLYEDATAARELTEEDVNRGALGHDWIDATCTEPKTCDRCGETEGTALGHDWEGEWSSDADNHWHACTRCDAKDGEGAHNPGAPATETTPQICTDCGYVIESATGHVCANHLTKVDRVEADCTNPGNIEHYKCSCGKLYEDATAARELTEDDVNRGALGHAESEWKTSTTEHWKVCTRADCGVEIPDSRASHADNNSDNNCDICGYAMTPAEYTITVTDGTATVEGAEATKATAGKTVTITANAAPSGQTFDKWVVESGTITLADANSTTTTFTMPAEAVSIKATYKSTGGSSTDTGSFVPTYSITVKTSENGDVTSSHKSAEQGTTVTLTVAPHKGYVMDKLTVLNSKNEEIKLTEKNGKYTFTMPAGKVTVEAVFKAEPFVDVPDGAYYEDAVEWTVDKEITTGTDSTHFSPDTVCTRAQAVTFLWRAAGSPAPKSMDMPFADVKSDAYYHDAVLWAVENGITKGTDDNHFSPDDICSRAQIVTLLWRAEKSPEVGTVNPFADVKSDDYYCSAVLWAVENGITNGTDDSHFSPDMNCSRAQIVTFIWRHMGK